MKSAKSLYSAECSAENLRCPICILPVPIECLPTHMSIHLPIAVKMEMKTSKNVAEEFCAKFVAELLLLIENRSKLCENSAPVSEDVEQLQSQRPAFPARSELVPDAAPLMKRLRTTSEKNVVQFTQPMNKMKCALCGVSDYARATISEHVWARHVFPKTAGTKAAMFYRCRLCNTNYRKTYSHFMRIHGSGKAADTDGKFDDLRLQFADEYRSAFAKCYPHEDERALGEFSIETIVKRSKKIAVTNTIQAKT